MPDLKMLNIDMGYCNKEQQSIPEFISEIPDGGSYAEFFKKYLFKNIPCIIKNVAIDWESSTQWVSNGIPDFRLLLSKYGSVSVPVTDCKNTDQCKKYILFKEYVEYLKDFSPENSINSILYLKDWHLKRENPEDNFYEVPIYFGSDWLNEYSVDNKMDDYMFVYFGPKGSWTPFHADVYTSFSWSANVIGQKKWVLLPPGEELKFIDAMGNLPTDIEGMLNDSHTYFQVIQETGDAIFIPSGWHHQVYNVEDTISINHNWINGCNIDHMWNSLKKNVELVEREIIEYKDTEGWMEHCQVMLKTLFGMNFNGFYKFVKYITEKRLNCLKNKSSIGFANWKLNKNHVYFDLESLKSILQNLLAEPYLDQSRKNILQKLISDILEVTSN